MHTTSPRHRPAALASALLAVLALVSAPAVPAWGDGDGDGEGGGHGGKKDPGGKDGADGKDGSEGGDESGGDEGAMPPLEKPTMDTAIDVGDPRRRITVKVPKSWKSPDEFEPRETCVALFFGPITDKSMGHVELHVEPTYMRAALALSSRFRSPSADDARSGPGWVEGASSVAGNRGRSLWCWERALEKDGTVYSLRVYSFPQVKDEARTLARQILDTAKVTAAPSKPAPPDGVSVKKAGDFDVWTDSDDKGRVGKAADVAKEARDAIVKALKGKPFDDARPPLKAFQVGTYYIDALKPTYGEPPDYAAFDPITRSTFVQLYRVDDDRGQPPLREAAVQQYLVQYFGGPPPLWIGAGLRRYAALVAQTGKAEKPPSGLQDDARIAIAKKCRRLDEWIDGTGDAAGVDANEAATELWAWHWFLRHGPGKKYGKAYQASLDALRQTGDLAASRKAWEGVDFEAMQGEFRSWASGWK